MDTPLDRMKRCAWLLVLAGSLCARTSSAQERAPYVATDSAIAAAAAAVVQNADRCGAAWPGYWTPGKPFGFTRREDRSVFAVLPAAQASWTPVTGRDLPAALRGTFYLRRPPADEFRATDIHHRVGEHTVPLVRPYSPTLGHVLDLLYHEAFHGHQLERFAPLPGGRATFGADARAIALTVLPAEFEAVAQAEREVLSAALAAPAPDSLRALLGRYFTLRGRRTAMGPDAQPFERYEEQIEGTAQYVGLLCAALATGADRPRVREQVRAALAEPLPALADRRPSKWRAYGVGAAMALLLDDMGVPGWRAEVEAGAALDDLLARALQRP